MKIKIIACYDNQGETFDRYTIVLNTWFNNAKTMKDCLALSNNPTHPQGFSQFSGCQMGKHLGKKIKFSDLPDHIQNHINYRLNEE
jgi:hypothetical protein